MASFGESARNDFKNLKLGAKISLFVLPIFFAIAFGSLAAYFSGELIAAMMHIDPSVSIKDQQGGSAFIIFFCIAFAVAFALGFAIAYGAIALFLIFGKGMDQRQVADILLRSKYPKEWHLDS